MPRCTKCHKFFPTARGVTRHRAQPRAACNVGGGRATEVLSLTPNKQPDEELDEEPVPLLRASSPPFPPVDSEHGDASVNFQPQEPDNQDFFQQPELEDQQGPVHIVPPETEDSLGRVMVMHPNPSSVFELGETFLTRFELDPYSAYRRNNLYYPFASRDDWKTADFLIASRLSMRRIDEFLSLPTVSSS